MIRKDSYFFLGYSVLFLSLSFPFAFTFGKFLLTCISVHWLFPRLCSVYWWAQRYSSVLLQCFWLLWDFLRFSISLLTLLTCYCPVSTFSISKYNACFVSGECGLSSLLACLVIFYGDKGNWTLWELRQKKKFSVNFYVDEVRGWTLQKLEIPRKHFMKRWA